ncbi:MAG TPA: DUF4235 domain-containing protein [Microlunatus sp.]|nr:DUF4235 domain-containing protein [Microlunatus sp.]
MSKLAKIVYRPVGLAGSVLAGAAAGAVVKQIWKRAADAEDAPDALQSEYGLRSVLIGAALQGAVFAVIKAAIDRGGARLFERLTGAWPGD